MVRRYSLNRKQRDRAGDPLTGVVGGLSHHGAAREAGLELLDEETLWPVVQ